MNTQCSAKNRQHGAVLIISLLVLLVLTLIGVSSLDGSVMEEKMASNSQLATATFQKSESSIRQAFLVESLNPPGAVLKAETSVAAVNHNYAAFTSTSQVRLPPVTKEARPSNASLGIFSAATIEIVGTASSGGMNSTTRQGYTVFPLMARPK